MFFHFELCSLLVPSWLFFFPPSYGIYCILEQPPSPAPRLECAAAVQLLNDAACTGQPCMTMPGPLSHRLRGNMYINHINSSWDSSVKAVRDSESLIIKQNNHKWICILDADAFTLHASLMRVWDRGDRLLTLLIKHHLFWSTTWILILIFNSRWLYMATQKQSDIKSLTCLFQPSDPKRSRDHWGLWLWGFFKCWAVFGI